jgi:hypothetical protein
MLNASNFVNVQCGLQTVSFTSKGDSLRRSQLIVTHNKFALKISVEQGRVVGEVGVEHSFSISVLSIEYVDSASMRKALSKAGVFAGAVIKFQSTGRASAALLAREFVARMERALRRVEKLDTAVCVE